MRQEFKLSDEVKENIRARTVKIAADIDNEVEIHVIISDLLEFYRNSLSRNERGAEMAFLLETLKDALQLKFKEERLREGE